ncbi:MAG TPA: GFA family protein [Stellaceae bacterium]|nr:GFA family protein [Stellaceae bacterium]
MEREGGCACGAIRYRLTAEPLIVHACHCRDCQRLTGGAFALNIWIERRFVEADHARLNSVMLTAGSGKPHEVCRCPQCGTALYSKYHAAPGDTVLLRAGTLDRPEEVAPDVHIFTRSKLPWLQLPEGARAFETFYKLPEVWSGDSLERWQRNIAGRS